MSFTFFFFSPDEKLGILNSGNTTHFHSQTGTFKIFDIFLTFTDALLDFNWQVLPGLYSIDHFPIILESV